MESDIVPYHDTSISIYENGGAISVLTVNKCVSPGKMPDGFNDNMYSQLVSAVDKIPKYAYYPIYGENLSSFNITIIY